MTGTTALGTVVAEHIAAVNAFDEDAIVATFADDALVNDVHREFWGTEAIRRWWPGNDRRPRDHRRHRGHRAPSRRHRPRPLRRDLPQDEPAAELILISYFTVRDGKIVSLIVMLNTPPAY